ncbi:MULTISPECIES: hypothetical protein [Pseudomonas]|uniref:Uncharacterized protein n=1 Tax=Pseudomonas oryzihabitans TaxID=47885 RepID=A0A178LN32_9PSED|nr:MULTISPECIES: hypothetical protein [Pseudomonas]NMY91693.1 hypothetical protein [Pseudomonas psychrotolerans]NMY92094.1 hypothetical protein [Pseudomonas psychrotolerans]NRH44544.1 hypothetical protein [Pseudomonas sp. MS15a(2019)]OAN31742.1 hypothetical protein A4V15_11820 [Pseudomonas oryzihabitans]SCZ48705.1 hypothetical protein SAMN05216279_13032 [Pseudomonas psychrotolerans]
MAIFDEVRSQLQELLNLVIQDEQYTAAVAHGVIQADQVTADAHHRRATRINELKRHFGLK